MILTPRLELLPATPEMLRAALAGPEALRDTLRAEVPATWPPEYLDPPALEWVLARLAEHPHQAEWWMYLVVRRGAGGQRTLIGSAGYKGPPSSDGTVEVGYGIVSDHRRQGLASEATAALVERAFADARVQRVIAETLPELVGSIGVLHRCGFRQLGPGSEPGVIRFERRRG